MRNTATSRRLRALLLGAGYSICTAAVAIASYKCLECVQIRPTASHPWLYSMDLHARQSRFGIGSVCTGEWLQCNANVYLRCHLYLCTYYYYLGIGTHRVAAARVVIIFVVLLNNTIDPASAIATVRINSPRLQNRILSSVSHPAYPAPVPSGAPTIGSGGLSWPLMPTLNGWDQHSNTILVCGHQCCRCEDRNTKVICSRTSLMDCVSGTAVRDDEMNFKFDLN